MKNFVTTTLFLISSVLMAQDKIPFTEEMLWNLKHISVKHVNAKAQTALVGISKKNIKGNSGSSNLYSMSLKDGSLSALTNYKSSVSDVTFVPNSNKIGYMYKGFWYEMEANGEKKMKIMNSSKPISVFKYSPNGKYVLYTKETKLRKAKRLHPDMPKADVKVIDDLNYRHWSHWNDNEYSHVFVESYSKGRLFGEKIDVMKNEPFDVPTNPFGGAEDVIWAPNSRHILYVSKKKEGKEYATSTNTDIYEFDIVTRKTKNLTKENLGYDNNPSFSNSGKQLAWLRMERDGYESDKNNIFVMNYSDKKRINLTSQFSETVLSYIWAKEESKIYFVAPFKGSNQVFELDFTQGFSNIVINRISEGDHNYGVIEDLGNEILVSRQDMNHATEIFGLQKNKSVRRISHINDQVYNSIELSQIEKRWIKTTDGKEMLTWVVYPPNFDKNKKYPTLLYCQGGPQSMVSQFYSTRWNFQLMAAKGYIVVAPNRRGLPGFGQEWNEAISKDWGGQPMQDYLSAIDDLRKEPFVDKERVGAVGASYGGYSVYMLAGIHENRFSSFISHCGLFNLESWYGTTEELFFANWDIGGPYWDPANKELYLKNSPHKFADNWNTPIMVIHGGKDFRVPENQGMEAFQLAQLKGLKSRFLYFPEENHWVLQPQNGMIWQREFFKWLKETL